MNVSKMCDSLEIRNVAASSVKPEQAGELSEHSRMQINDTKAGMGNIDKDKINSIIKKHSQSIFKLIHIHQKHPSTLF